MKLTKDFLEKKEINPVSAYEFSRSVFLEKQVKDLVQFNVNGEAKPTLIEHLKKDNSFQKIPLLGQISTLEIATYMEPILLRDTDQMSLAHALEVRVPFLDHELVELIIGIEDSVKYPNYAKQLLVESLGNRLPHEIVHRPKMGFVLPFEYWMKHELKPFCERMLNQLADLSYFNGGYIHSLWTRFLAGDKRILWTRMWGLIVLAFWLETNQIKCD